MVPCLENVPSFTTSMETDQKHNRKKNDSSPQERQKQMPGQYRLSAVQVIGRRIYRRENNKSVPEFASERDERMKMVAKSCKRVEHLTWESKCRNTCAVGRGREGGEGETHAVGKFKRAARELSMNVSIPGRQHWSTHW